MSRLLAVTVRELRERWLLFPASLLLGFSPLVLPAFGVDRRAMPLVGVVTAVGFAAAAAILMGSTMLARDAADGRLAFLFSRPLSWRAVWGAKWLAAVVMVAASGLLAAIPTMAAVPLADLGGRHGDSWLRAAFDGPPWSFVFVVFLLGVGVANFAATAYRSRSPWVALDMVVLVAAAWIVRRHVAPLWRYGLMGKNEASILLALLPLAVGLVAGSAAQVAAGRTDLRRAHRALSLVFWAVVGAAVVAAAGYWHWVLSAGPADVSLRALARDPGGRWVYVEGSAPRGGSYPYGFLVDSVTGQWAVRPQPVGADGDGQVPLGARFSGNGRFLAELRVEGRGAVVVLADLSESPPRLTHVSLASSLPPDWSSQFALSPTGDTGFVANESGASIFGFPSGRRLAAITVPPGWRPVASRYFGASAVRTWFVPWNLAAHMPLPRAELLVVDLEGDGRSRTSTAPLVRALDVTAVWRAVRASNDASRVLTFDGGTHLRDGATGALLATLAPSSHVEATSILADGRVVVAVQPGATDDRRLSSTIIRVFDRDGTTLGDAPLDAWMWSLSLGAEVAPGRVLVSSRRRFGEADTLVLDVAEGRILQKLDGLSPTPPFWFGPAASALGDVSGSVQFLTNGSGRVLRHDFATGTQTTVAGPGAARGERLSLDW
jgi:hypothetical protein